MQLAVTLNFIKLCSFIILLPTLSAVAANMIIFFSLWHIFYLAINIFIDINLVSIIYYAQ